MVWVLVIAAVYLLASAAAFVLYWVDKRAARRGDRRVQERTLHIAELLGGWPGAFVAQRMLRHKTRDTRFQVVYWSIVALHLLAWALWMWFGRSR